jgi:uroporphyrin-III C-methyltransferase/precorrin-2 dehydrogenase/sirohydrochlorin ferrochelatase
MQYITGHARNGALPDDIDWRSLADPTATTAVYMPVKTLAALVAHAVEQGLDPATPALAIARATRPDQATVTAAIGDLPERLKQAALPGPVLVMIGEVCASASADVIADRHDDRDVRAGHVGWRRR